MKPHVLAVVACCVSSMSHLSVLCAQQPAVDIPRFEVVAIKLTRPDTAARTAGSPSANTYAVSGLQLRHVISLAYGVAPYQVSGGPSWVDSQAYDIVGKVERPVGKEQFPRMLRDVLADRFGLKLHKQTRQMSVYALVVEKAGPKLTQTSVGTAYSRRMSDGRLDYTRVNIEAFTKFLSRELGATVVDMTGLDGYYDLSLEWRQDGTASRSDTVVLSSAPSIFTAVREQLGLLLEWRKMPMEFLVIDQVQRPSEN